MEEDTSLSCTTKNCNLKFQSETNLKLHSKKHEMVLTLNKTNISATDQTPTPTRFIRNCEEIGLFQDLQNVNPFEETFRKAAENVKKGFIRSETPSYLSKSAGDDLHTPHLFPELRQEITIIDDDDNNVSEEVVVRSEADTSLKTITPQPSPQNTESVEEPVQVILKLPSGGFIQLSTKPLQTIQVNEPSILPSLKPSSTVILAPTPEVVHELPPNKPALQANPDVKTKLKAFLGGSTKSPNFSLEDSKSPNSKSRKTNPNPKRSSEVDDGDKERRQKVLERNREAAYRCRAKRKKWVEELVRKAELMSNANRALVQEVTSLKEEVVRLKGLLLSHANCPITLSSQVRIGYPVMPKQKLTLNLEKAAENEIMDLDSPVVKKDEVLSSAAPPTPDERIVTFPELVRDHDITEVCLEDKSSIGTTVIQINPNVLKTHSFS